MMVPHPLKLQILIAVLSLLNDALFFLLDSLHASNELHAKVIDPKFRFCSQSISLFLDFSMYPGSSMPK